MSLILDGSGPHNLILRSKNDDTGITVDTNLSVTFMTEIKGPPPISKDFSKYRGDNFISEVLRQGPATAKADLADIKDRMARAKASGVNFLRVPFYWDHILANPAESLLEVEYITREAGRVGIAVQWDFHHFHTGAYNGGDGFPDQYTKAYPLDNSLSKQSDKAWRFWQALIYDEIPGFRAAWWNIMQQVFDAAKKGNQFGNWSGVEFCNEPQVSTGKNGETNVQVFSRFKALYQYFADKFRARYGNEQFIVICEANGIGRSSTGSLMPRRDQQHLCFPVAENVVYAAHRYNTPLDEEFGVTIPLIIKNANLAGCDVRGGMVQEWALGGGGLDPPSLEFMRFYMGKLKEYNLGWSIWADWGKGVNPRDLHRQSATDPTGYELTQVGQWFKQALQEVYGQ